MKLLISFILFFSANAIGQSVDWMCKSDSVMLIAESQLGTPYKYGSKAPNKSFDCSGFVSYVYDECGIESVRTSRGFQALGEKINLDESRPGDCILFSGTKSRTVGHIGIVVENDSDGVKFIHCSSSKRHFGVVVTDLESTGYKDRFVEVRRLF